MYPLTKTLVYCMYVHETLPHVERPNTKLENKDYIEDFTEL